MGLRGALIAVLALCSCGSDPPPTEPGWSYVAETWPWSIASCADLCGTYVVEEWPAGSGMTQALCVFTSDQAPCMPPPSP